MTENGTEDEAQDHGVDAEAKICPILSVGPLMADPDEAQPVPCQEDGCEFWHTTQPVDQQGNPVGKPIGGCALKAQSIWMTRLVDIIARSMAGMNRPNIVGPDLPGFRH